MLPNGVLATKTARVEVEAAGRTAAAAQRANIVSGVGSIGLGGGFGGLAGLTAVATPFRLATNVQPVPPAVQDKVLKQVDDDLVKEGILAKAGSDEVGARLAAELNFERTYCLPTQGIVVKGCLDRCNTCEESRQKSIALDLVRKDLENQLLAKQIALLEKSQEYRSCPVGEAEPEDA